MFIELNLILYLNFYLKNKKNNSDRQNRTAVRCVLGTCTNHYTISLEVIKWLLIDYQHSILLFYTYIQFKFYLIIFIFETVILLLMANYTQYY